MAKGRKLKIFSFFAGCGILDLGFEKAGYDIEFVNEFFKPFQDAYIYSRKMMKIRPPKYGYANTDVNSYINENKHQLEQYIEDAKKDWIYRWPSLPRLFDCRKAAWQRWR